VSAAGEVFRPAGALHGALRVPGDKSITQRALILAGLCERPVRIVGPLWAGDTEATAGMLEGMGVTLDRGDDDTAVLVRGRGLRGLEPPASVLDARNSATAMRLLAAVCAGQRGRYVIDGDESLRTRPMDRIVTPLRAMGARIAARDERYAPLEIDGGPLRAVRYRLPVASAQVKSAVLLAGLFADGETTVEESIPSRDHTERMLSAAGVPLHVTGGAISVTGVPGLQLDEVHVPGDISSAAFFVAAAALVPGSDLQILDVGLNPTRTGLLEVVRRMGADVTWTIEDEAGGEPRGTLRVRHSPLVGTHVSAREIPALVDEVALVALLACYADGETVVEGVAELRVKESDRLAAIGEVINGLGGDAVVSADSFVIHPRPLRGGSVDSKGDHRLAMLGAVAGLVAPGGVAVDGFAAAAVTFPGFRRVLEQAVS
jgi:3-phosphoshikimate 1-carboxyvinyltransferase